MKNILLGLLALTSLAISNPIQEREIFLNINSKNIQLGYESEPLGSILSPSKTFKYDISYLNGKNIHLVSASLKNVNVIEKMRGSKLGVGIEAIYLNYLDDDLSFLPLSISFKYNFPALMYNIPPVSIDSKLSFAPAVLSFNSDSENYYYSSIEINLEPIRDVKLYTGFRNISSKNIKRENGILNEFYGGLKMNF